MNIGDKFGSSWMPAVGQTQKSTTAPAKQEEKEVFKGADFVTKELGIPIDIKDLYGKDGDLTIYGIGLQKQLGFKKIDNNNALFYGIPNDKAPLHQIMRETAEPYKFNKNTITKIEIKSIYEHSRESLFKVIFFGKDSTIIKEITLGLGNDNRL